MSDAARLVVSIDVEDWPQSTWDHTLPMQPRCADNARRVLDVLGEHGVTATLFVLGKFAQQFPDVVRRIHAEGHDVASHGFGHVEVFRQTREEFREDVARGKKLVEDLIGQEVIGYRAPDFSIVPSTLWALDVLREVGFRYDSSIFPIEHDRYGIPSWPDDPVIVDLPSGGSLVELPIATVTLFGRRLPVGGGGYHRLLPRAVIAWAVRRRLRAGSPFVAYLHPYELDGEELGALGFRLPLRVRLHQGLGRGRRHAAKLEALLTGHPTASARELALGHAWRHVRA